ncbi:MAG: AAA family ATPase [Candidatus Competibacterales bacterium]
MTAATDLYAWGLIAVECLTGRRPAEAETLQQTLFRQLGDDPLPLPREFHHHPVRPLLEQVLHKDLRRRLANPRSLLKALTRLTRSGGPAADPGRLSAADRDLGPREQRPLTVLCCEVVDVLGLAAALDAEAFDALLSRYWEACSAVLTRHGRPAFQRYSRGFLVYFGYPKASEHDASWAVRLGLALAVALGGVTAPGRGALKGQVAIATGLGLIGESGDGIHRTITGFGPLLAQALAPLAPVGGVIIDTQTRQLLGQRFILQTLPPAQVAGLERPVTPFQVLGERPRVGRLAVARAAEDQPWVGRTVELALLEGRWQRVLGGEGQGVLIRGVPGIGKSRLLRRFRRLTLGGCRVWSTRGWPHLQNSPLLPVADLVTHLAGVLESDGPAVKRTKLQALVVGPDPEGSGEALAALLEVVAHPSGAAAPQNPKTHLFGVLLDQLEHRARRQPVALLVEDLHWCDPTTVELLQALLARLGTMAVLVVMTARPEFAPRRLGPHLQTVITLDPLEAIEAQALVDALPEARLLSPRQRRAVIRQADGVPLFVEELTRAAPHTDALREIQNPSDVSAKIAGGDIPIPPLLQGPLLARLDSLGEDRDVAQRGAVIGRHFSRAWLAAMGDEAAADLDDALERLVASQLLVVQRRHPEAWYSFRHALLRDIAYQSLPTARRRELHERVAQALEEATATPDGAGLALLAHHFARAGRIDRALSYWQRAAQHALGRSGYLEVIGHCHQALDTLARARATAESPGPEDFERRELALLLLLARGHIARRGPGAEAAVVALARAQACCQRLGWETLTVHYGVWLVHMARNDARITAQMAAWFRRSAPVFADATSQFIIDNCLGMWLFQQGDHRGAAEPLHRAAQRFTAAPRVMLEATFNGLPAPMASALNAWLLGDLEGARRGCNTTLALAERLGDGYTLAIALVYAGMLAFEWGDDALTSHYGRRLADLCEAHGFDHFRAVALGLQGRAMGRGGGGDPEQALELLAQRLTFAEDHGLWLWYIYYAAGYGEALLARGRVEEAEAILRGAFHELRRGFDRLCEPELWRLWARVRRAQGAPDPEVDGCYQTAWDIADARGAWAYTLRTGVDWGRFRLETHDLSGARRVVVPLLRRVQIAAGDRRADADHRRLQELGQTLVVDMEL